LDRFPESLAPSRLMDKIHSQSANIRQVFPHKEPLLAWRLSVQRYSVTDLGTLGGGTSNGQGINASGQVTGEAMTTGGVVHAFLYANRVMRDLNSMIDPAIAAYVTLISGKGINDDGWIVANGVDSRSGKTHACLLSKH
jgi:probable HAF family extracellular repeat protein